MFRASMIVWPNNNYVRPSDERDRDIGANGLGNTLLRCLNVIDNDVSPHPAKLGQREGSGQRLKLDVDDNDDNNGDTTRIAE
jgi:hypothetical protein